MKYSFIEAQPKRIFSRIVEIWWLYIFLALGVIGVFYIVLNIQVEIADHEMDGYGKRLSFFEEEIQKITAKHKRAELELNIIKSDDIDNYIIKDGIINFLNLIPDQITINYIQIDSDALVIKGITPSKEVFKYLLQNPLKAIFDQSEVTFYMLSNGWYKFVSESHSQNALLQ
ncbi:membrane protein [Helicobacter mustelae]|uniref:Putative membrane protein n=1 Tax=Helicobacter mustelae (strain ATCC 43772 / CCUG 25715 / CIP 103759 / LMG 18044 / NCTC 12198 / R85-136P) TaxID=679897 RepID=D3UG88_HELM1|nr:membrane protein [Helicobacter mustelae]CBG39509.1 Putative membrane protein [Helicobacter mustelae 12198]SQH71020.1 membrane protein [Helicobacter mustelae]STP12149.1 membrane protein [Helicobacter mustelae]